MGEYELWVSEIVSPVVGGYLVRRVVPGFEFAGFFFVYIIQMTRFGA